MKLPFEYSKLYKLTMPGNGLDRQGILEAWSWVNDLPNSDPLKENLYNSLRALSLFTRDDDESDWNKWLVTSGTYAGTWVKRFAKYHFQTYNQHLSPDILGKIGEIVRRYAEKKEIEYYFEFAHHADWAPGQFGESSSSCWWDSYDSARTGLINNGGCAILLYKDEEGFQNWDKGLARCWLYPYENRLLLFNAYAQGGSPIKLITIARIVATVLGYTYKKIGLSADNAWVNDDTAWAIMPSELMENTREHYNVAFSDKDDRCECANCGDMFDRENSGYYDGDSGNDYCDGCYDELFTRCENCDTSHRTRYMHGLVNGGSICNDCAENGDYVRCGYCESYLSTDDSVSMEDTGNYYCSRCAARHVQYYSCSECGSQFEETSTLIEFDSKNYCPDCAKSKDIYLCHDCNKYTDDTLVAPRCTQLRVCPECYSKRTHEVKPSDDVQLLLEMNNAN